MDRASLTKAWDQADLQLISEEPIELSAKQMASLYGGKNSAGLICSVSAECSSDGVSCWKKFRDAFSRPYDGYDLYLDAKDGRFSG